MCGIFALFNYANESGGKATGRQKALTLSKRLRHRGPDWSGCRLIKNNVITHERLAIVGVESGAQPLVDGSVTLTVNGEIYNYRKLQAQLAKEHDYKTESDCEVIIYLYEEKDVNFIDELDGMFSFVLYDSSKDRVIVARDPIGITTLYAGFNREQKSLWFASELKSLHQDCDEIIAFPPGCYFDLFLKDGEALEDPGFSLEKFIKRFYNPAWFDETRIPSIKEFPEPNYGAIRQTLEEAVHKRLMAEVPFGVLLSGGLDSSLIASIAARAIHKAQEHQRATSTATVDGFHAEDDISCAKVLQWWPKLHSFSIGVSKDAPDVKAAREVAKFLATVHHEYVFTIQEGLDALSDIIYHLETYDVTTVRASTPMYLLSRRIKSLGVKMVLSGEGSDEIFGGYLYFYNAPSAADFHVETVKRVKNLHLSDCLRANKSTMAWGLEARVPFLDKKFLQVAMETIAPEFKQCILENGAVKRIEKYVLRKAFDTPDDPYLPDSVLWRQKEQFSDGVGYSWIDELKQWAEMHVTDDELAHAATRFPHDTPTTKEAYYYRTIFEHHFPEKACLTTVMRWIPRRDWGCAEDPSGRAQQAHAQKYDSSHAPPHHHATAKHSHPVEGEDNHVDGAGAAAAKKLKA